MLGSNNMSKGMMKMPLVEIPEAFSSPMFAPVVPSLLFLTYVPTYMPPSHMP
jgi:hypothetical protein